jgi:hypothetical protein
MDMSRKFALVVLFAQIVLCLTFCPVASAQSSASSPVVADDASIVVVTVPRVIGVNGTLRNRAGQPLTGVVGVEFAMYRESQGGAPIWMETQNLQLDEQGRYGALVGAMQSGGLALQLFASNEPRWLGVRANVPGEEEQPRVLLASVPYALKAADADTIGGKPASAFVLREPADSTTTENAATTSDDKSGANATNPTPKAPVEGTGTTNMIAKWLNPTTLTDSAIFESGTRVGINTTSPIGKLNVVGDGAVADHYITLSAYQADTVDKGFLVRTARGTAGVPQAVQNGNILFNLYAQGHDGVDYGIAGGIAMAVDGTVSAGKVPGLMLFSTADSNGVFAERMRVNAAGRVGIGTTTPTERLEVAGNLKISGDANIPTLNGVPVGSGTLGSYRTRGIVYVAGCDTCSVLQNTDDQKTIYVNVIGSMAINEVRCYSDPTLPIANIPTINILRDDGTPNNILAGPLTCNGSSATPVQGESTLALNEKLDFDIVDVPGALAKRVTVVIKTTVN